jgi:hypothetical protein
MMLPWQEHEVENRKVIVLMAGLTYCGENNWASKVGTQTSFVQSMKVGMIWQHMKLTEGKGIIAVMDLRGWPGWGRLKLVWHGRRLQNTLNKGDLIGGAAEMIDHNAKRHGGTSSWVKELEEVCVMMILSCGFYEPRIVLLVVAFNFRESESK